MQFWKSLAIGLIVLLGISYVGFAYVYSQGGGIMIAGMVTGGMQPKIVTLLRNSNITFLPGQPWNTSLEVFGYRTGVLYCEMHEQAALTYVDDRGYVMDIGWYIEKISVSFETDGIQGGGISFSPDMRAGMTRVEKIEVIGNRVWISAMLHGYPESKFQGRTCWAVMSMSLYLRD